MKRLIPILLFIILLLAVPVRLAAHVSTADDENPNPSYAWRMLPPLGLRQYTQMDTLLYQYYLRAVPSALSPAFLTTGNQAAAGKNMVFLDYQPISSFFLIDAKRPWLPSESNTLFYNTRLPMTMLSYYTGGGREVSQDNTNFIFSGNLNQRAQIGAFVDYPYSKGSYAEQASKGFNWGLSGSYISPRYDFQGFMNTYNMMNKESGGITDDLYITDPAKIQGGFSTVDPKTIPTHLTNTHNRIIGQQYHMNHRYKLGFWKETRDSLTDSVVAREYIPVTSLVWTFDYHRSRKIFATPSNNEKFWDNHYVTLGGTHEVTRYQSLRNTLGLALLEGFNRYAKAGLSAFLTFEHRRYGQAVDSLPLDPTFQGGVRPVGIENLLWAGAQLTKQQGSILRYEATAQLGIGGRAAGELILDGRVDTRIPLFADSVQLSATGLFSNTAAPYLMNHYYSNHFAWNNDFGMQRRLRLGGELAIPQTGTSLEAAVENLQNLIYFGPAALPLQHTGHVQVISTRLNQDFRFGILNWRNTAVWQLSSNQAVVPLPAVALYSNLYLGFKIAGVLTVNMGVDGNWYTAYNAPAYQPATMTFYNQTTDKCGNFLWMNAYANFHLDRARFFVMYSHFNQGYFGGDNYFSTPHYPLDPARFMMGVSVNFIN